MATATSQLGEPLHGAAAGPVRSAWWSWVAPHSGWAEVRSCSATFKPLVGVYTGFDVAQLSAVPAVAVASPCAQPTAGRDGTGLGFHAVGGTTYRIAAATDGPVAEQVASVGVALQPAGDDFENAQPLSLDWTGADVAFGLATVQPGEPAHGGRTATHSMWFVHTPTRRERLRMEVCYSNFTPVSSTVAIYRGTALHTLTEVASSEDHPDCGYTDGGQVEALLEAGVTYHIALTRDDPAAEQMSIRFNRSPHDDSALTPSKLTDGRVDLALATGETGEPAHAGHAGGRSRWRVLTPAVSHTYQISSCAPAVSGQPVLDSLLAVYEGAPGTPAGALTPVAANDDGCSSGPGSVVRFRALAGHRYLVAIDSKAGVVGEVALAIARSPHNDDRDRAVRFDSRTTDNYTTLATAEPGEPAHAGEPAAHSLWFRWVAPRSGIVRLELCGASFDAVAAVYGAQPGQPALAAAGATPGCLDPDSYAVRSGPQFDLAVTAGLTYLIAVDGRDGATGVTGRMRMTYPTLVNDDFADATSLAAPPDPPEPAGAEGRAFDAYAWATAQLGEPAHAGRPAQQSSWARWTATRTGFVTLSSCAYHAVAGDDTTLAVYTGNELTDLTPIAAADGGCPEADGGRARLSFYAVEGTIYRIAADIHGPMTGAHVTLSLPPANDRFNRAHDMNAGVGSGSGSLDAATREPGEPDHAGRTGGRSLWYAWTAPRTEVVVMSACGYFDTLLAVYTGSAVDDLVEVTANDDAGTEVCEFRQASQVRFVAQAGTRYRIAIDGKDGATGSTGLGIRTAPPADRFATAAPLSGAPGRARSASISPSRAPSPASPPTPAAPRRARPGCASRRRPRTCSRSARAPPRRPTPSSRSTPAPSWRR